MDDWLARSVIITLSFETQANKHQLSMDFPQEVNVIRRIKSFAFNVLEARPTRSFEVLVAGLDRLMGARRRYTTHSTKLATVGVAIPPTNNASECARNS